MSFASLKKNRGNALDKLAKQLSNVGKSNNFSNDDDGKYWKVTKDAAGNGFAIIRFLPSNSEDEKAFVQIWDHGFKGKTGKWYINKSLTTIGKEDPVGKLNSQLWNSGIEADKAQAREQKRRLKFVSNILVVNDPENPSNNGKVFLFAYPKKIYDKINDIMYPEFPDEPAVNPFDMWTGANFRYSVRKGEGGWPDYTKCRFDSVSEIGNNDDEREAIFNMQHSLDELIDPANFKSYAELEAQLNNVLGLNANGSARDEDASNDREDDVIADLTSRYTKKEEAAPEIKSEDEDTGNSVDFSGDEDEDDELAVFRNMRR